MKNLLLSLTVLVSAASFIGCKSTEKSASTTSTPPEKSETTMATEPQLLASIQRTACFGQCPMYRATFLDNGEVKYVGKRFVKSSIKSNKEPSLFSLRIRVCFSL